MKFILGRKIEMTQIFRADKVIPVTKIKAGPCFVVQIKEHKCKDRPYFAVQVGFEEANQKKVKKPQKYIPYRYLSEYKILEKNDLKIGAEIKVDIFKKGEKIDLRGMSKGKGFQGVVKRHGFHGSPASHGHKDQLRMPGSIGSTDAARVFKGKKMAGRMGGQRVTVKNLEIIDIIPEENLLFVKGAVPGAKNSLVKIIGD
ncbi:50S ribosomal protein L3 [Candidatus Parcubacteria bacterium 4484_255]|nr:MAG: 50S ribosomal protein L3 [Candidatus Parcubacteria bacterium 4484_255]